VGNKLPLGEITKEDLARGSPPLLPDSWYFPGHLMIWAEACAVEVKSSQANNFSFY